MDFECDDDDELLKVVEQLENHTDDLNVAVKPEPHHLECLQKNFGHLEFRPMQWKVIRSIIEDKRDNCCIMSTGYGKSLCFQFPPVFSNGIAIIISPLISLMQDQVKSLNLVNIKSCMLGSAQTNRSIENDVLNGEYRIVYASPEYISGSGSDLIGKLKDKITVIAVDEAHCISSWGSDFRPKYLELKNLRQNAPDIPILAVTATASDRVQQDICTILKLKNPQIICTGFDRPNLEILVRRKTKDPWDDIGLLLRSKFLVGVSCIVYCLTRKATDNIYEILNSRGIKCGSYHAGKTQHQRKEIFDKFIRDEINVIVATVAFGMGIDKSDVRCVIHYGTPADMDGYYQEIGRAGRDGVPSKCILFYSDGDFEMHRHFRMNSRMSNKEMKRAEDRATVMKDFIYTKQCRRLKILQYFDGPSAQCPKLSVCCDNCRTASTSTTKQNIDDINKELDFSKDAKTLIDAISIFDGFSGISKPIAVLRGSKLKTIERYHNHKLMGSGKHMPEQYWKILADSLEQQELLQRQQSKADGFGFTTIKVTYRGKEWAASGKPLKFVPSEQLLHLMSSERSSTKAPTSSSSIKPLYDTSTSYGTSPIERAPIKGDEQLKRDLIMVRAMIASREGTMPYKIASEPAIDCLVRTKPLNMQELREAKVDGFTEAHYVFGPEFLKCIQRSKGFLPESSTENVESKAMTTAENPSNQTSSTTTTEASKSLAKSDNGFEDDDELFLSVEIDCEKIEKGLNVEKSVPATTAKKITRPIPKRVKYENSSSDEETSPAKAQSNLPVQDSSKPVGIRKRNIF
ncbi:Werner syndrome ATP-dependent helicase like [Pseudolycoriella hygida]|uniref:ATP-dependent DNA helicase n=1 Tax=Pseudolycoriella hygida TaxID=35572 RepID=A0A9Q0S8D2_9DIPT|nr:Werner syndrome ATP-dependent helicase like [Pseudolycoriella hygida]